MRSAVAGLLVLLGVLAVVPACSVVPKLADWKAAETESADKPKTPVAREIRVDGDGLALGEIEGSVISPREFLETVIQLLDDNRPKSAQRWIHRYPDVALDVLRNATTGEPQNEALLAIAAAHDRQCTTPDCSDGWEAVVRDRASNPNRYVQHDRKRQQFMLNMRDGRVKEALKMRITAVPKNAPGALLGIDAWRLGGIALLLDERPDKAVPAFERAAKLAGKSHPYENARLKLLKSEAQRRAGRTTAADATWQDAVRSTDRLLAADIPVIDPVLWERIAYMRPVNLSWPVAVRKRLAKTGEKHGLLGSRSSSVVLASTSGQRTGLSDERPLWACMGYWRLKRHEPQAALIALKRAEAMATDQADRDRLQLAQAKALLALDQEAGATATLVRLAGGSDPQLSRAAMATLGIAKLQAGSAKQGFNLLRRAIEEDETIDWPNRAEVEADLGLAYLLVGNEQAGLHWLHRAQARFKSADAHENLVQSLENELSYLKQAGKKSEARSLRQRLANLETI